MAAAGFTLLTAGVIGYGTYRAIRAQADANAKTGEKSDPIAVPRRSDGPVVFPVDPNTFNPVGLVKRYEAGTKNGGFMIWLDPLTNVAVFRWDENPNYPNGPHYHIVGQEGHYPAGSIVPEPYASIYFPFK